MKFYRDPAFADLTTIRRPEESRAEFKARKRANHKAEMAAWDASAPPRLRYTAYLQSEHWKAFKLTIFSRRGRICEHCFSDQRIQVHHLTYARLGKELAEDVAVLCDICHRGVHFGSINLARRRTA